jgi:hypothetical protein
MVQWMREHPAAVKVLAGEFTVLGLALVGLGGLGAVSTGFTAISTAVGILTGAEGLATVGVALGAPLLGPIGLAVLAIGALGVAIYAFRHSSEKELAELSGTKIVHPSASAIKTMQEHGIRPPEFDDAYKSEEQVARLEESYKQDFLRRKAKEAHDEYIKRATEEGIKSGRIKEIKLGPERSAADYAEGQRKIEEEYAEIQRRNEKTNAPKLSMKQDPGQRKAAEEPTYMQKILDSINKNTQVSVYIDSKEITSYMVTPNSNGTTGINPTAFKTTPGMGNLGL